MAPPVTIDNSKIMFFPDFTTKVQKQGSSFLEVKRTLRQQEIKYAMLFPSKLRVEADGKTWFFTHPDQVWDWLDGWRTVERSKPTAQSPTLTPTTVDPH